MMGWFGQDVFNNTDTTPHMLHEISSKAELELLDKDKED